MKVVYIIVSIIAILVAILFCFLTAGCISASVREVTMSKKQVLTPTIEHIEMSGILAGKPITFTGRAIVKSRELSQLSNVVQPNYRRADGIMLVWGHLFALLKCWLFDLIIVNLLICILTEVLGKYVKPAGIKIPKMILSVLIGGLIAIVYLFFLSADWTYTMCLCGSSIVIANVGWQYVINEWGGNKIGGRIARLLGKRRR